MKILVLNAGSSSLKWKLWSFPEQMIIDKGLAERIGEGENGRLLFGNEEKKGRIRSHEEALSELKTYLFLKGIEKIDAVGHRVVHGGNIFVQPVLIDNKVKQTIQSLFTLAPLHNPPNYAGIEAAEKFFPDAVQVAVFDTAFHQTIPETEHRFAIPDEFYDQGIRQYGFHGISHAYVSKKAIEKTGGKSHKMISLHLGNGASATAVMNGRSVAHSMGFGPLSGLIMGTRSGDIDPSVLLFMSESMGIPVKEISRILNKESGMKALAGFNDMREVEKRFNEGDSRATLALKMYAGRVKKYIGYFMSVMNGLDTLIFTAGIGENSPLVRELVCQDMDFAGIKLDGKANKDPQFYEGVIHAKDSKVGIFVIPTDEEKEIATETYRLIHA